MIIFILLEIKSNVTQINESSKLINDHNFNHNTNIKKNEIVYLTHFEAMDEVYVVRNITQFNEINRIIQNCELINCIILIGIYLDRYIVSFVLMIFKNLIN